MKLTTLLFIFLVACVVLQIYLRYGKLKTQDREFFSSQLGGGKL